MHTLQVGDLAPDFTLRDQFGQDVTLSSYRGSKAVLIFFFPFAFSGVCRGELAQVQERLAEFVTFDSEVLALSCDPLYSLRGFSEAEGLTMPLLADFWPHGEVARSYDVFDDERGCPRRSTYLVDRDGRVVWALHNAMADGRDLDEHLRQLQSVI